MSLASTQHQLQQLLLVKKAGQTKSEAPYQVRCLSGVDPDQILLQDQGHPGQNGEISFVTKTLGEMWYCHFLQWH